MRCKYPMLWCGPDLTFNHVIVTPTFKILSRINLANREYGTCKFVVRLLGDVSVQHHGVVLH